MAYFIQWILNKSICFLYCSKIISFIQDRIEFAWKLSFNCTIGFLRLEMMLTNAIIWFAFMGARIYNSFPYCNSIQQYDKLQDQIQSIFCIVINFYVFYVAHNTGIWLIFIAFNAYLMRKFSINPNQIIHKSAFKKIRLTLTLALKIFINKTKRKNKSDIKMYQNGNQHRNLLNMARSKKQKSMLLIINLISCQTHCNFIFIYLFFPYILPLWQTVNADRLVDMYRVVFCICVRIKWNMGRLAHHPNTVMVYKSKLNLI